MWIAADAKNTRNGNSAEIYRSVTKHCCLPNQQLVQTSLSNFCAAIENLKNRTIVSTENKRTRLNLIHHLSAAIRRLARQHIFPEGLRLKTRLVKDAESRKKSLAELHRAQFPDRSNDQEYGLNRRVVTAIRACAEKDLMDGEAFRQAREAVLNGTAASPSDAKAILDAVDICLRAGTSEGLSLLATGQAFIVDRYEKKMFRRDYSMQANPTHRLAQWIGKPTLDRWLGPTAIDFTAAFVIALCDTGWNFNTLHTLKTSGVRKDGRSGTITLSSIKMRSRGRRTVRPLEAKDRNLWRKLRGTKISPAGNIERWETLKENFCQFTHIKAPKRGGYFWVLPNLPGRALTRPTQATLWYWLQDFKARHAADPTLGGLDFGYSNIRPSVMQLVRKNDFSNLLKTQAVGDHMDGRTTFGYINTEELRQETSKQIRRFQRLIEQSFKKGIAVASVKLFGVPSGYVEFLDRLFPNGSSSSFSMAIQERDDGGKGKPAVKLELKRFAASEESLCALYLLHKALKGDLMAGKVDQRWKMVWLKVFCLCEVLIEKIAQSPYLRQFRSVVKKSDSRVSRGELMEPKPW